MQDWLAARTYATPHHVALITGQMVYTYAELNQWVSRACAKFAQLGIQRRMTIGVLMTNNLEYVVTVHALVRLGAILVPLNTRLKPTELNYQLENTQVNLLLYGQDWQSVADQLTPNQYCFRLDDLPSDTTTYADEQVNLDDVQAIVFTSGTSGHPKGAQITLSNHFYSAMASAYRIGHDVDDRWLSVLPLYHVGGLAVLFRSVLYGITVVLHAKFDDDAIVDSMQRHQITLISLVPTMLYRLMKMPSAFPEQLRLILLGGAAASPELLEQALAQNLPIAVTYGLTEATSQVATTTPNQTRQKLGTVGKPLLFTQVQIVNEAGDPVPEYTYGEIVVSGQTVMAGYWNNPEANQQRLRDGRLFTGDIGYLDSDGDLWLVQRRSDLIVTGGENVYPSEVETVLRQYPLIEDVCVVGVPHVEWGQQVVAAIIPVSNVQIDADELRTYIRESLAGYKQPHTLYIFEVFPQTASGKIARKEIEKLLSQNTTLSNIVLKP